MSSSTALAGPGRIPSRQARIADRVALIGSIAAIALLTGCATPMATPGVASATGPAAQTPDARMVQAATAPLSDLDIVRAPIPPVLLAARQAPYGLPADASCPALTAEIESLDAALGADLDTPSTPVNPSLIERGTEAAGDALVGAVRNTTEGVIPFRGWVRRLTGAERYSRKVSAAIAAGSVRRGFLKGLGQAAGCPPPASPRR